MVPNAATPLAGGWLRTLLSRLLWSCSVVELLAITAELRHQIANDASAATLEAHAKQAGMSTLFESGCRAVDQGLTTFEELVRILGMPDDH